MLENAMRAIGVAVALTVAGMATMTGAQQRPKAVPPHSAQAQAPAPASNAATVTGRTEILTYDNWTVTCVDGREPKEKRVCSAELNIFQEVQGQRRAMFSWVMGLNKDGVPTIALRFPPGVLIAPGVELKFADRAPRKVPIISCEPAVCEASTTLDDGFIRDASSVIQGEAVIQASDGRLANFTINMKGFAQAAAAIRR
jgi:invasion protein IalB